MNEYEAYELYTAINRHFSLDNYDYFLYNGKIANQVVFFKKNNYAPLFLRLSKHEDPKGFLLATITKTGKLPWIVELARDPIYVNNYKEWIARKNSLSYRFKEDLNKIGPQFTAALKNKGTYPALLYRYKSSQICIETLIIINEITGCFSRWGKKIEDPVYWPKVHNICVKYRPFLEFDVNKYKKILLEHYT